MGGVYSDQRGLLPVKTQEAQTPQAKHCAKSQESLERIMRTINVEGVPDHLVQALERQVAALRREGNGANVPGHDLGPKRADVVLPRRRAVVIGRLGRDEIYDHFDGQDNGQ